MSDNPAPNVLIVMSDQHDPSVSSMHGHPFVRTPAFERLASRGAVFENAYCNSPLCVPSRMSFMTGKHVHRTETWDLGCALASDEPTWAHRLNALGYETALFGKMHFIGPDRRHGFRVREVDDAEPVFKRRGGTAFATPAWGSPYRSAHAHIAGPGETPFQIFDDQVVGAAKGYLTRAATGGRPWAASVNFITPHTPPVVREEYWSRFFPEHADLPDVTPEQIERLHPQNKRFRSGFGVDIIDDEYTRRARAAYYGLVSFADDRLGALLDHCDELGISDSTVIVYVSDHGEMHGEHGLWHKCTFYEQSVRIPLAVSWPERFGAGVRLTRVVSLVDLVATLLELAGAEPDPTLDGRSLVALLEGREPDGGGEAFAEYEGPLTDRPARMLRRGRYKLNVYLDEPPELFDLEADPGELTDLAADPEHRSVLEELTAAVLDGWDPVEIDRRVRASQKRRRLVADGDAPVADTWLLKRP